MQAEAVAAYLRTREREGRLYPDEIVRSLPVVPTDHPLAGEWRQRAASAARLTAYLRKAAPRTYEQSGEPSATKARPVRLLEVGCGNGWLAARLAEALPDAEVVGLDANAHELEQAQRVFGDRPNLHFRLGDAELDDLPPGPFRAIVLASAVQYVVDLPALLRRLGERLDVTGEIHLLDSPFYAPGEAAAARRRTAAHYAAVGVPEMAAYYRHHVWDELAGFQSEALYRPPVGLDRLWRSAAGRTRSPFPWLRIRPAEAR